VLRTVPLGKYRISLGALLFCGGVTFWLGNMLLRTGGSGFAALTSSLSCLFLLLLVTSGTRTMTVARLAGFYCLGGAMMSVMYLVAMEFVAMEGARYIDRNVFVPIAEETLKLAPVAFFLWRLRDSRLWTLGASDVVLMAATSGAGFALIEDAYLRLNGERWDTPIDWLPVASISGDHLVAGHGIWTGLAGASVGLALLWRGLGKARYLLAASGWLWSVLDHISNNYAAGLSLRHDDPLHDFLLTIGGHGYFTIYFFFAALAVAIVTDLYVVYATLPLGFVPRAPLRVTVAGLRAWWATTLERRKLAYLVFRTRSVSGPRRAGLLIRGALIRHVLIGAPVRS
jgi:RsiW-degrading membrane proteinase PrsW (M82 family)